MRMHKLPMVYVLATQKFEYIKIGTTKNFKGRFGNIQTGCPFTLFLWLAIRSFRAKEIEKELHITLGDFNIRGEWFVLGVQQLDYLIEFCAKKNIETRREINALF